MGKQPFSYLVFQKGLVKDMGIFKMGYILCLWVRAAEGADEIICAVYFEHGQQAAAGRMGIAGFHTNGGINIVGTVGI